MAENELNDLSFLRTAAMQSYLELQRRKILCGKPTPYVQQPTVAVREPTVAVREPTVAVREPSVAVREPTVAVREPTRAKDVASDPGRVAELESQIRKLAERLSAIEQRPDPSSTSTQDDASSRPSINRRRHSATSLVSRCSTVEPTIFELEEPPIHTPDTAHFPFHAGTRRFDASQQQDLAPRRLWALWEHFRTNVDPILKMIHIPAVQHLFLTTDEEFESIAPDAESLKWAICFAAVASLRQTPNDASSCQTSDALLSTYASKVEQCLAKARLLAEPTVVSVQALAFYLICGQRFLDSTYTWSLTAVLVRVATKLKLNKDPETQGISFLDGEYRRRLWWHICALDAHTAEMNGTDPLIYERQCTARFPLAMQDADFDTIEDVETRRNSQFHASETFCSLLRFEITYYMRTVLFSADFAKDNGWPVLPSDGKLSVIEHLDKTLQEKYYRSCKCGASICKLAIASSRITVARRKLAALVGDHGLEQLGKEQTDQALSALTTLLDNFRSIREDPSLSRWAWLCHPHAEWNAAAMCLSALVLGNWKSKAVTRAWNAITTFFNAWKESSFDALLHKKWVKLERLKARVEKMQAHAEDDTSTSPSGYKAYSPNASLSAKSVSSDQRTLSSPSFGARSQAGSVSSKSSGSARSASGDEGWPFPKENSQETVEFDMKTFALLI